MGGGGGGEGVESLTFWTGVLMCLFGVWSLGKAKLFGLKFRGPTCAVCAQKIGVDQIIWGMIFRLCQFLSHFLVPSWFWNCSGDYLGSLKKLVWLFEGLRNLLDINIPFQTSRSPPPPPPCFRWGLNHWGSIHLMRGTLCIILKRDR